MGGFSGWVDGCCSRDKDRLQQSKNNFRSLDGSIQNIQVDSQLAYSQSPVILYLSPTSKSDESRHMPAIHFTSHKTAGHSATTDNAEIFKHLVS